MLLLQLSGGSFAGSNTQRLRPGRLGPPAVRWPKGVLWNHEGIYRGIWRTCFLSAHFLVDISSHHLPTFPSTEESNCLCHFYQMMNSYFLF